MDRTISLYESELSTWRKRIGSVRAQANDPEVEEAHRVSLNDLSCQLLEKIVEAKALLTELKFGKKSEREQVQKELQILVDQMNHLFDHSKVIL